MNDHWDTVGTGIYSLNKKGMKALADYMNSEEGRKRREEFKAEIDKAMLELEEEWAALSFEEQFKRHQSQPRLYRRNGNIFYEV